MVLGCFGWNSFLLRTTLARRFLLPLTCSSSSASLSSSAKSWEFEKPETGFNVCQCLYMFIQNAGHSLLQPVGLSGSFISLQSHTVFADVKVDASLSLYRWFAQVWTGLRQLLGDHLGILPILGDWQLVHIENHWGVVPIVHRMILYDGIVCA